MASQTGNLVKNEWIKMLGDEDNRQMVASGSPNGQFQHTLSAKGNAIPYLIHFKSCQSGLGR